MCKKIASGVGALKRSRPFVPLETLQDLQISSLATLGLLLGAIWGYCNKTLSSKDKKLQNGAARTLSKSSYNTNADFLIKELGWIKLDTQRPIHKATMVCIVRFMDIST